MIKGLRLQGFQSYIDSNIEFSERINVITGSSNAGKSAILKGLNWLDTGLPKKDSIINHSSKEAKVSLFIDDNVIEKVRSNKENCYYINSTKQEATIGDSLVPEKVKEITNFTDLNLQTQFSKFFLLEDSPGEVARKLNQIIDLEIIDETIKKIKNTVYKKKKEIDYLQENIKQKKKEISTFKYLDKAKDIIEKIEILQEKEIEIEKQNLKLHTFRGENTQIQKQLNTFKNIQKQVNTLKKIKSLFNKLTILKEKNKQLCSIKDQLLQINKELEFGANLSNLKKYSSKLKKDLYKYEELQKQNETLIVYEQNIKEIQKLNNDIFNFKQLKSQILPKGQICPLCRKVI